MTKRVFTQPSRKSALVGAACAVLAGTLAFGVFVQPAADLKTRRHVPRDGQVRIGSNTKTFTATVVLQLVGEN